MVEDRSESGVETREEGDIGATSVEGLGIRMAGGLTGLEILSEGVTSGCKEPKSIAIEGLKGLGVCNSWVVDDPEDIVTSRSPRVGSRVGVDIKEEDG